MLINVNNITIHIDMLIQLFIFVFNFTLTNT